ncbi:MAG: sigma-70 family RNA polymerase sigma factor [Hyphococcus sp.]
MSSTKQQDIGAPQQMQAFLLQVAESGDRRAFAEIYAYYAPRVKGFLMRGGASAEEAEDLAQDAMVKVLNKAKLFDPQKASVSTWIFTIARNARIDAIRKASRGALDPDEPALMPEESPRADDLCELKDQKARIMKAVSGLPPEQLEVMRLHFYEDEPHSVIAERLGLPLGTVKSRLRLAFEKVRREIDGLI